MTISYTLNREYEVQAENGIVLSEIIDAPELLSAYPELKNIPVVFADKRGAALIYQDDGSRVIRLDSQQQGMPLKSALNHEIQHVIQDIEGFASGGSAKQGIDHYNRLAGEVEARNVQSRLGMSEEERRNTLIRDTEDVAREDQIFLRDGGRADSASPMKSTQANIKRGREAMNKALTEKISVHRAMYRNDTGWIDFVWGDVGKIKSSGKTKGGKGLSHIIESRMRKDAMTYSDATEMLTERVVDTIAKGQVVNSFELNNSQRIDIENKGNRVSLIRNKGSNSWVITSFDLFENKGVGGENEIGSVDTSNSTQSKPTLTRQGLGAPTATNNTSLNESLTQDNSSGDNVLNQSATADTESQAEFDNTASRYGGEDAYNKAKADGKTKLNYRQWVQVRTPRFKKWFGDWEFATQKVSIAKAKLFNNAKQVREWAEDNVVGVVEDNPTGEPISISKTALKKYLNHSAVNKSVSEQAHFSAATVLPEIIQNSVVGEVHPDYKKVDGVRSPENGVNENADILRLYGAVDINGEIYRVKTTINRFKDKNTHNKAHSYEVSEIELLSGTLENAKGTLPRPNNAIPASILLQDVTKSYNDKLLLDDVSKVTDPDTGEPLVVYHGTAYLAIKERKMA